METGTKPAEGTTVPAIHQKPGALAARPDFIKQGSAGTENITNKDIQMPRLALAQQMSPELVEGGPRYVEGLKTGMMFHSLTHQIYGKGPLKFMVLRQDKPRHMQFSEDGKTIIDFNVPANDPRTEFTTDAQGKSKPPVATKFYDYIILLPEINQENGGEVIGLSMKGTNIKVAKLLNTYIKQRQTDIYAGLYTIETKMETSGGHTYAIFSVENAGWPDQPLYERAKAGFEAFREAKVDYDTEVGDTDFPHGANVPGGETQGEM